ncbi:MAG: hypothetical protein ABIP58_06320 [Dehalococcoidia bacterium]
MTRLLALLIIGTALLLAACSSGSGDEDAITPAPSASGAGANCSAEVVHEPIEDEVLPLVISSDLALGENRFVIGLIDQGTQQALTGADVHLQFLCFDTEEGTPAFEADPDAITLTKNYTHTHEDGVVETHEAGETGAYVTYVNFDRTGDWGIVVTGKTADGRDIGPVRPTFSVNATAAGLALGEAAPLSEQPTTSSGVDLSLLDTSEVPNPTQHEMTVAEAVASGKPTVVAFVTPAFCQSQICGPVKGIFDDLNTAYEGQANFIHIEPYDVSRMRDGSCESIAACLVPTVNEWRLQTEPWVFIVGSDGSVAAKFDGIASYEEMDAAMKRVLGQ